MAAVYSINNDCSTNPAASVLWYLYNFLKTSMGWTVAGTSDGSTGGMVDGNITGVSSLTSQYAWFAMTSPNNRQVLFSRGSVSTEAAFRYNRSNDYSGGTATTLPTATNSITVYSSTTWFDTGYYHFGGDTASPYPWYLFGYTGTTARGHVAFLPMADSGVSGDSDPYVMVGGTSFSGAAKAWRSDLSTYGDVYPYRYYVNNATQAPGSGPLGVSGEVVALPMLWSSYSATYANGAQPRMKGLSTFLRWTLTSPTDKTTLSSRAYIVTGSVAVPWDGATDPL